MISDLRKTMASRLNAQADKLQFIQLVRVQHVVRPSSLPEGTMTPAENLPLLWIDAMGFDRPLMWVSQSGRLVPTIVARCAFV
jgi:hypothetical protein